MRSSTRPLASSTGSNGCCITNCRGRGRETRVWGGGGGTEGRRGHGQAEVPPETADAPQLNDEGIQAIGDCDGWADFEVGGESSSVECFGSLISQDALQAVQTSLIHSMPRSSLHLHKPHSLKWCWWWEVGGGGEGGGGPPKDCKFITCAKYLIAVSETHQQHHSRQLWWTPCETRQVRGTCRDGLSREHAGLPVTMCLSFLTPARAVLSPGQPPGKRWEGVPGGGGGCLINHGRHSHCVV